MKRLRFAVIVAAVFTSIAIIKSEEALPLEAKYFEEAVFAGEIDNQQIPKISPKSATGITLAINKGKSPQWRIGCLNLKDKETIIEGDCNLHVDEKQNLILEMKEGRVVQERSDIYEYVPLDNQTNLFQNSSLKNIKGLSSLRLSVKCTSELFNKQILFLRPGITKEDLLNKIAPGTLDDQLVIGKLTATKNTPFQHVNYVVLRYMNGITPDEGYPFK
jgi:hypothetical protein